ncbi:MAG: asparagine synthase (glutamine-hydrolyzing) [Betaproteobacteria bacterium]
MCGIFGIGYHDAKRVPPAEQLRESARRLLHRGPDATGVFASAGVGLAHTRLSFLDVDARSNQPLWDAGGRYCLVFNGEIYNFAELRRELEAGGVAFRTTGDTEVLLHSLIHHPAEKILPRLQGMFAFAFYDSLEGTWLLARDRFGMKPVYIFEDDQKFMFGSEIKALRPWWEPDLDSFSIASYLLGFGGPTKGFTFYRGVRSLAPGGMVRWRPGRPSETTSFFAMPDFWDPARIDELRGISPTAAVDRLEGLLLQSVRSHMFADVPVGAFCSGGVDSSLIMAMASKSHANLAIFHANVKGRWSEHHAAAALSRHLKLDLKTVDVEEHDFIDRIPDVMSHYEHPFTYHPNCAPLMMVSQLARDCGVKGLLSGEGSDECFLGYPWLARKRAMDTYLAAGRNLRTLVHRIPMVGRLLWPYDGNTPETVRGLFNRREIEADRDLARRVARDVGENRVSDRDLWTVDYLGHHLRALLHRNDSMGMAASIEARFPFLDHEVVGMAVNLPVRLKLRFSPTVLEKAHPFVRDKWIVRKVADRYIPRALSQRIKIGFWTTIFERAGVAPDYFDHSFVRDLFQLSTEDMRAILADADQGLAMRLLHLDVWGETCVRGRPLEETRRRLQQHVTVRPE